MCIRVMGSMRAMLRIVLLGGTRNLRVRLIMSIKCLRWIFPKLMREVRKIGLGLKIRKCIIRGKLRLREIFSNGSSILVSR